MTKRYTYYDVARARRRWDAVSDEQHWLGEAGNIVSFALVEHDKHYDIECAASIGSLLSDWHKVVPHDRKLVLWDRFDVKARLRLLQRVYVWSRHPCIEDAIEMLDLVANGQPPSDSDWDDLQSVASREVDDVRRLTAAYFDLEPTQREELARAIECAAACVPNTASTDGRVRFAPEFLLCVYKFESNRLHNFGRSGRDWPIVALKSIYDDLSDVLQEEISEVQHELNEAQRETA